MTNDSTGANLLNASKPTTFDEWDELTPDESSADSSEDDSEEAGDESLESLSDDEAEEAKQTEDEEAESEEKKSFLSKVESTKKLAATVGDEKIEIPAAAKVPVVIDGEQVEVDVQELINNYSGNEAVQKRFTEYSAEKSKLAAERRLFDAQKKNVNQYLNNFVDQVNKGNVTDAIVDLVSRSGDINPIQFRRQMRQSLLVEAQKLLDLSPEQLKILEAQEEAAYYKRDGENARLTAQQQEERAKMQARCEKVMQDYGIPNEAEFIKIWHELETFHKQGLIPEVKKIEPEHVGHYYKSLQTPTENGSKEIDVRVEKLVEKVNPSLKENQEALGIIKEAIQKYNPDDATLEQLVKDEFGNSTSNEDDAVKKVNERARLNGTLNLSESSNSDVADNFDPGLDWESI